MLPRPTSAVPVLPATLIPGMEAAVPVPPVTTSSIMRVSSSRSEEHTSELQSPCNLVCRLLLEKKKHKSKFASGERSVTHLRAFDGSSRRKRFFERDNRCCTCPYDSGVSASLCSSSCVTWSTRT